MVDFLDKITDTARGIFGSKLPSVELPASLPSAADVIQGAKDSVGNISENINTVVGGAQGPAAQVAAAVTPEAKGGRVHMTFPPRSRETPSQPSGQKTEPLSLDTSSIDHPENDRLVQAAVQSGKTAAPQTAQAERTARVGIDSDTRNRAMEQVRNFEYAEFRAGENANLGYARFREGENADLAEKREKSNQADGIARESGGQTARSANARLGASFDQVAHQTQTPKPETPHQEVVRQEPTNIYGGPTNG